MNAWYLIPMFCGFASFIQCLRDEENFMAIVMAGATVVCTYGFLVG
jgi:hypothetical protein